MFRGRRMPEKKRKDSTTDKYNRLILAGMEIPESVDEQKKAQENNSKMADTPVPSLILSLSVSTVLTMLVATTYNIVATYFLSDLGEENVAAVGVIFPAMALIQAVGYTWGMGAGSELARMLGCRRRKAAEQTLATALMGSMLSGGVLSVLFVVMRQDIVMLLGATDTCAQPASQYGLYIMMAAPFMCGAYVLNNGLRAAGQPYLALLGISAGGAVNALLDYILIRRLGMGIRAAGIAACAGQGVSLAIMYLCVKSGKCVLKIGWKELLGGLRRLAGAFRIVRTGLPSFFRQGLMCIAAVLISRRAGGYGDGVLAGITVANKIFAVIFAAVVGYGQAFAPVCGFAYGAGDWKRVRKSVTFTVTTAVTGMAVLGTALWMWGDKLAGLFLGQSAGDSDLALAVLSLKAHALSMPWVAVCLVMGMYYQALGAYKKATLISAMRQGIFFIPLMMILPGAYGADGVAVVQASSDILSGVASGVFLVICLRSFRRQMKKSRC